MTEENETGNKKPRTEYRHNITSNAERAIKMGNWALKLRYCSLPWPTDICDPYEKSEIINFVKLVFFNSLAFIFYHEYAHAKLGHQPLLDASSSIAQETEADGFSLETVYNELPDDEARTLYLVGVVCADISMLYSVSGPKDIQQAKHADIDIRMFNHLEFFQLVESNERRYIHTLINFGLLGFIDIHELKTNLLF